MADESTSPFKGSAPFAWGTFYPKGYVIAVIDDGGQAEAAATALQQSGFAQDDVRVLTGEAVLNHHAEYLAQQTRLERVVAVFVDAEKRAQEEYLQEAQLGNYLVIVHAPERAEAIRALMVLTAHGAHAVRHYTPTMVAELRP